MRVSEAETFWFTRGKPLLINVSLRTVIFSRTDEQKWKSLKGSTLKTIQTFCWREMWQEERRVSCVKWILLRPFEGLLSLLIQVLMKRKTVNAKRCDIDIYVIISPIIGVTFTLWFGSLLWVLSFFCRSGKCSWDLFCVFFTCDPCCDLHFSSHDSLNQFYR